MVWEYYVKSRKAEDYRQMLLDSLYHPPAITIDPAEDAGGTLYLDHHFEGKPLVREFIANTMLGHRVPLGRAGAAGDQRGRCRCRRATDGTTLPAREPTDEVAWQRVIYTMEDAEADEAHDSDCMSSAG